MCRRPDKIPHPTRESAFEHAAMLRKGGKASPDLEVYRCEDHWHIGKAWVKTFKSPHKKKSNHISAAKRRRREAVR